MNALDLLVFTQKAFQVQQGCSAIRYIGSKLNESKQFMFTRPEKPYQSHCIASERVSMLPCSRLKMCQTDLSSPFVVESVNLPQESYQVPGIYLGDGRREKMRLLSDVSSFVSQ